MSDRIETHRGMAKRMYEPQVSGYQTGNVDMPGAWSADGRYDEAWQVTLFSAKRGDWSHEISGPESMDANKEFQMYWTGIPDFGIKKYEIFPHEDGWIGRLIFGGTALDGTEVRADEVDIVTTDERGRVVRVEWHVDRTQWNQVFATASGKSLEEVGALVQSPDDFNQFIANTIAKPDVIES